MRASRVFFVVLMAASFSCSAALAGRDQGRTVLVIPSRYRVVQFCQDIARIRPVYIVAWGTRGGPDTMALYFWNAPERAWKQIGIEEYSQGTVFDTSSRRLVLIGDDKDLPADLASSPAWAAKTERIRSLNPLDLSNGLNADMNFTPVEWRWLAKRYGLIIKDLNAERRRYGKYGPPGSKKGPLMPEAEESASEEETATMPPETAEPMKIEPIPLQTSPSVFDVQPAPAVEAQAPAAEPVTPPPAPAAVTRPEDK